MSRQRVFIDQPAPTSATKLTENGNNFRVSDIIVTTADVEYEFRGYAENGDAVWKLKPNIDDLALKIDKTINDQSGLFILAEDQSTDLLSGNKIKFATVNGTTSLTLNADGSITLPAGEYEVYFGVRTAFSGVSGIATFGLFKTSDTEYGQLRVTQTTPNYTTNHASMPIVTKRIILAVATSIEVQVTSAVQLITLFRNGTHISIRRIK